MWYTFKGGKKIEQFKCCAQSSLDGEKVRIIYRMIRIMLFNILEKNVLLVFQYQIEK